MELTIPCLILFFNLKAITAHAVPAFPGDTTIARNNAGLEPYSLGTERHNVLVRQGNGEACDRCKRRCTRKRIKDPTDCSRCIRCPPGMKPDPLHVTCINDGSGEEDENKRKGNCPDGTILDPKEGPQNPTAEAKDLKCALDDEKDCKPPKLPETRPNGKENDASFIPKCFDADESDTKCDEKQQYVEVTAGSDGKAKKTCKPTRQYENKKKNRLQKMKDKFKQRWEEKKEERAKKDEERKGRESKIEEGRKKKEKEGEDRKKMRSKLAKCSMAAVLEKGQEVAGLIPQKRDLVKRDGGNSEVESYMDMTACYFDAEFVENDEFLDYWPSDINVDDIGIGVDEDAYIKAFMERLDHVDLEFWNTHDFCKRNKNGTLDTRCTRRKRGEIISQKNDYEEMLKRAERALKRDITKSKPVARDEPLDPENFCDMSNMSKRAARGEETTKKRNPFLFFAEIAASAARMAGSLIARAIPKLASFSPRLSQLLKNSPKNLFKLAPKGQSTNAGSRETMKQAFRKIADHPAFKKCLRDGKPN